MTMSRSVELWHPSQKDVRRFNDLMMKPEGSRRKENALLNTMNKNLMIWHQRMVSNDIYQ